MRGNDLKLETSRHTFDLLNFNFTFESPFTNTWNSTQFIAVASSVNSFKYRRDKFWKSQLHIHV